MDIGAGDRAVALMKSPVGAESRAEVVGGIGGFAGLSDASKLAPTAAGVGHLQRRLSTKVVIAQRLGLYDTVGIDLVAMVVDDLATCGAEQLFMTDYVVFGTIRPQRSAAVSRASPRAACARAVR